MSDSELCLYRSWNWPEGSCAKTGKACMPKGGLISLDGKKPGETMKTQDGTTWQVVRCKWRDCYE